MESLFALHQSINQTLNTNGHKHQFQNQHPQTLSRGLE